MLVSLWMTRDPAIVAPEASISDAALIMSRHHVRRLPVVRAGRLVGIVTTHDVARAYPPDVNPFSIELPPRQLDVPVAKVMTPRPLTVGPATPIETAARLLREKKIGAVPVVAHGALVGILTESDVFRAFLEMTDAGGRGVRVTFDLDPGQDVVAFVAPLALRHGMRVASVLSMDHEGRHFAAVRVIGQAWERFVDDVARGGHRIVSVVGEGA